MNDGTPRLKAPRRAAMLGTVMLLAAAAEAWVVTFEVVYPGDQSPPPMR